MTLCWKCQRELDLTTKKISFRATCDHCSAWLHVCVNCRFYQPGLSNDCRIPETLTIADKETSNHCEEFQLKDNTGPSQQGNASEVEKRLFGDASPPPTSSFEDLFHS